MRGQPRADARDPRARQRSTEVAGLTEDNSPSVRVPPYAKQAWAAIGGIANVAEATFGVVPEDIAGRDQDATPGRPYGRMAPPMETGSLASLGRRPGTGARRAQQKPAAFRGRL
jgi:hypothetical protein